jgi:(R,R)-butanediol dehydrogenase/meso-butanediol dehydrogenase/diacetyl reductase
VEPAAVAVHACDRAEIRPGSSVLITGAGPIGALAVLAAKAAGAATIIVSDPHPRRRARIKMMVPEALVLDPRAEDVPAAAASASEDGVGLDAAIECAGIGPALQTCIEVVRRQGIVVQVGLHTKAAAIDVSKLTIKDIRLLGSYCYPVQIWPRVLRMIAFGMLPVTRIVTDTIALDDAVALGFERLINPFEDQLKILIRLGESM